MIHMKGFTSNLKNEIELFCLSRQPPRVASFSQNLIFLLSSSLIKTTLWGTRFRHKIALEI